LEPTSPIAPVSIARRKPRADIYTMMLVLSLIAVLVGILFLYLYNADYEWKYSGAPPVAMNARGGIGESLAPRLVHSQSFAAEPGRLLSHAC
jgi:hypothetical protein